MADIRGELIQFWKKTSRMHDKGLPLVQVLQVGWEETNDAGMKAMIHDLSLSLRSGKSLAETLARHPSFHPPSVQTLIKMGEMTGTLDQAMLDVAQGLEDGTFNLPTMAGSGPVVTVSEDPQAEQGGDDSQNAAIRLVNQIIVDSVAAKASDIHVEWNGDRLRVRRRVDGVLEEVMQVPQGLEDGVVDRLMVISGLDLTQKALPQDNRARVILGKRRVDFRASFVPFFSGPSLVLRILDKGSKVLGLEEHPFSQSNLESLRAWMHKPTGVILITGPTGSGKSSTAFGILQELNSPKLKITTVENPVEFEMEGVNQLHLKPNMGLTAAMGIRCELRHDADILMVGDIADPETAQLTAAAGLSGHLVIGVCHANDAPEGVRRLLDMGVEPYLVNQALIGVTCQRLVRKICQDCKAPCEPDGWVADALKGFKGISKLFRGKGCDKCGNRGYRGRVAIHELMEIDEGLKRLIAQDADQKRLGEQAVASGMVSMFDDAIAKVNDGLTTIDEILRVCEQPSSRR